MGTGYAEGENRAVIAADNAIHSPLLDDISIVGAQGILINITGGEDMTLYDINDATQNIYDAVGDDVETNIVFGAVTDPAMNGKIRVTVIATGFDEAKKEAKRAEKAAPKMTLKMPATPRIEARAEQMEFVLPTTPALDEMLFDGHAKDTTPDVIEMQMDRSTEKVIHLPVEHQPVSMDNASGLEIPTFTKPNKSANQQVFVSKGRVITHYEDDMDVPTFLRKQMQ